MNKIIKDWFTEIDNQTFDVTKALAVVSILTAIGLIAYSIIYKGQVFSLQDYGIGMSTLFVGLGVALKLKKETGDK